MNRVKVKQKLTKILATIGPASDSEEIILDLLRSGVDVFRFNTKHGDPKWHEERINRVQRVADRIKTSVGILIDLQGPELRIETKNQETFNVEVGDEIKIALNSEFDRSANYYIPHHVFFEVLEKGDTVLIDDGFIEGEVITIKKNLLSLKILTKGHIKHRKGVNLPGKYIDLPSLIEADLKQLDMASMNKVDFVALSFARSKEDIETLKQEMKNRNVDAHIVAKIESAPALENLDELIDISDAVMVARGDLGVEVPIEQLAYWQKEIIRRCRLASKTVITATQMLESMIEHPRPTRAEATDVANAVFDGTDAVMLSAETAAGNHPVTSVKYMAKIAAYNEAQTEHCRHYLDAPENTTEQVVNAAIAMLQNQSGKTVDAIVVFTETGYTAKSISSFRPHVPIIAVTDRQKTVETLTLSYGVTPIYTQFPDGEFIDPDRMLKRLTSLDILEHEDKILVIYGKRWKNPGLTNSISILTV